MSRQGSGIINVQDMTTMHGYSLTVHPSVRDAANDPAVPPSEPPTSEDTKPPC